ncbi:MAG: hypothetical protein K2W82_15040 [Candidatus Obscuribacterales bacterium]|nr:hypothetical protein [Candidatus Obscuribacterales bacterium]
MPNIQTPERAAAQPAAKPKIERVHSYLTVASTAIGICGALGSLFVWLAANFYVGNIELKPEEQLDSLVVKVYNREGHESTYHSKSFQLMPGKYHLEVLLPENKSRHFDTEVIFQKTTEIPFSVSGDNSEPGYKRNKRSWWQFWRHKQ